VALLDVTRTDDRHTAQRLSAEPIIWLGTVRPDGRPHNVPVWFAWHDPMVLIFSMPETAKVRDVRLSPRSAWRWTRQTADRTLCWPRAGPSSSPGQTGIRTS
jgi:PPOX class probable F420-dependent enzyme